MRKVVYVTIAAVMVSAVGESAPAGFGEAGGIRYLEPGGEYHYIDGEVLPGGGWYAQYDMGDGQGAEAFACLSTGEIKTRFNAESSDAGLISAAVQPELWDTFTVDGPGPSADLQVTMDVHGTLGLTASGDAVGMNSIGAGMSSWLVGESSIEWAGGCLDICMNHGYAGPGWQVWPGPEPLWQEGTDYQVFEGQSVDIDTTLTGTVTLLVGEPCEIIWEVNHSFDMGAVHPMSVWADFWSTCTMSVDLAPGFEAYTLERESGLPEPATLSFMAAGLLALTVRRRR